MKEPSWVEKTTIGNNFSLQRSTCLDIDKQLKLSFVYCRKHFEEKVDPK
jgi:hypothetical protein